jgi:hypothetical protein
LTEQQISGFFSREASRRRRKANVDDDSFPAAAEEDFLDSLWDLLHRTVDIQHPIVFDTLNVCELVKTNSLTKQSVSKLKDICTYLNIAISDIPTKGRKRPYVKKIESFVEDCTCFSQM